MRKLSSIIAAVLLIVSGCFVVSEVEARVCFATDEDCGAGGNFGDTSKVDLGKKCEDEGYTLNSDCLADPSKRINLICPYSGKYGTCCSLEYKHNTCIYPLEKSGEACGKKYKCVCDRTTYKYTAEICAETNARIGGAACSEEVLPSQSNALVANTYYSECRCDRGLYPYYTGANKEGYGMLCDPNSKEEDRGQKCTEFRADGTSESFYASCPCNTSVYPVTSVSCLPYEADETQGRCFSGGTYYYETCRSCSAWPAQNLDHVAKTSSQDPILCDGTNDGNCDYERCPYRVQDRNKADFLILRCNEPGYRPSTTSDKKADGTKYKNGEACVPESCEVAVKAYLKAKSTNYAIFDGTKLVNADGNTVPPNGQTAIVVNDISVSAGSCPTTTVPATYKYEPYGCGCKTITGLTACYTPTTDIDNSRCSSGQTYCCTGSRKVIDTPSYTVYTPGGLNCLKTISKYISGAELARKATDDYAKALKVACTTPPTITYTGTNFPYSSGVARASEAAPSLDFTNVDFKFSNNTTTDAHTLHFYNNKITVNSGKTLTLNGATTFKRTSSYANSDRGEVALYGSIIANEKLTSDQYDYNKSITSQGTLGIFTDKTNAEIATITLSAGGIYKVKNTVFAYDSSTDACVDTGVCVDVGATMKFNGASASTYADVYTNAYIGAWTENTNYSSHDMHIKLDGAINWNLYSNSGENFKIHLTPHSSIYTDDINSGNFARILRGSGSYWKSCSMASTQKYAKSVYAGKSSNQAWGECNQSYWTWGRCQPKCNDLGYGCNIYGGDNSNFFVMASVDKDYKFADTYVGYLKKTVDDMECGEKYSDKTDMVCPTPNVYVSYGKVIVKDYKTASDIHKDTTITQQLITCSGF